MLSYRSLVTTLACSTLLMLSASRAHAVQFTFSIDSIASGSFETKQNATVEFDETEIDRLILTYNGETLDTDQGAVLQNFSTDNGLITSLEIILSSTALNDDGQKHLRSFSYLYTDGTLSYGTSFYQVTTCPENPSATCIGQTGGGDAGVGDNIATYTTAVPEPATLWLFGAACLGFVLWTRRQRRLAVANC